MGIWDRRGRVVESVLSVSLYFAAAGVLGEPVPFPGSARSGGAAPPYWRSRLSGGPYRAISSSEFF